MEHDTTPQCRSCRSKDHPTKDHLTDTPLWCINCKGNHNSLHKECNTHRIRLGLKPIPNKNADTSKENPEQLWQRTTPRTKPKEERERKRQRKRTPTRERPNI